MSQPCERYESLRTRWVDGVAEPGEALDLRLHLESCEGCAEDVRQQREVRGLLRARAADLGQAAPEALRRRVQDLVAGTTPQPAGNVVPMRPGARRTVWAGLRVWVPRSAAAAILLAVAGVVAVGALAPRGSVLAAQLALDHLKCLVIAPTRPGIEAAQVERQWAEQWHWSLGVPPSAPELGLELVGLRTCLYHDGHMAHVLYDWHGQRVSLFVMPQRESASVTLGLFGQQTRTWSHDGRTYALVTGEASGRLEGLAAHFEAHAR